MDANTSVPLEKIGVIDLYGTIETPENVVLTFRLAGPGLRLWAYSIDFLVRFLVIALSGIVVMIMSIGLPGIPMGMWLLIWFFMEWGYFAASEGFFRGKTIGKHALSLRVIQDEGYPISFWSALLRNFLRAADFLPFFYCFGFISMMFAGKFLRLGDIAAGTMVIQERRVKLPREPIILEKIQPLDRTDIGSFVPAHRTLVLIEEFLERRFVLTHRRGHEMASILAGILAKKLDFQGQESLVEDYPMAFLARVYVTFHPTMSAEDDDDAAAERAQKPRRKTVVAY